MQQHRSQPGVQSNPAAKAAAAAALAAGGAGAPSAKGAAAAGGGGAVGDRGGAVGGGGGGGGVGGLTQNQQEILQSEAKEKALQKKAKQWSALAGGMDGGAGYDCVGGGCALCYF